MFAISVRVSPCSARSGPRSVGRVTRISPSACSIFIRCGTACESSPSGPFTWTRPGESATETVAGSSMGCLPIRDMRAYQTKAMTSPPMPRSAAWRLVTRPLEVDRMAMPSPPSTRGSRSLRA